MLTYVINTSENKTFDSNLLFELVGYSQIRWKHCSLNEIDLCADEICEEERSKILSTGEYRIVVLVDFFDFPKTNPAEEESAGEYVEIYKAFLEHYLLEHLFYPLKKKNIPAKACEIYYIQYVPYAPLAVNRMAMSQTEELFALADKADNGDACEAYDNNEEGGETQPSHPVNPSEDEVMPRQQEVFRLTCAGGVCLPFSFKRRMTFEEFYTTFANHRDDPRKFGVVVHKPYVTFGDASRAAYDALSLSLYLVYLYERRDDVSPDTEIRRMDDKAFVSLLRNSLRKIHSARSVALKNECRYYKLEFERKTDNKQIRAPKKEEKKSKEKEKRLTEEEKFAEICRLAARSDGMQVAELRKDLDALMLSYLSRRDDARSRVETNAVSELIELEEDGEETVDQCPSDIEKKNAIKAKKEKISGLLKSSLEADYSMQDFSEEKEQAVEIYKKYKQAKACETRNIIGDVLMLFVTIACALIPYGILQFNNAPFTGLSFVMYACVAGVFGGLFAILSLLRLGASVRAIRRHRQSLNLLYDRCMKKKRDSIAALRKRYEHDLVGIEELRQDIREIDRRDKLNREKNRHVEMHRETLEVVENLLSGMLNSFGEKPDISQLEDVRDDFKIDKPITAVENKIYKIFSMDAIDTMFKKKGEDMR